MKISLSIPQENTIMNHGYGLASYGIVTSLQALGHQVPFQDPTAPVELNLSQPYLWRWSNPDAYHIGMVAWESTKIPNNWKVGLKTCDELWTPSPLVAEWFEAEGYKVDMVYEHGVDSKKWSPKLRKPAAGRPIKFLHIGEPAPRKGGQLVYEAFRELFGNRPEHATLTIKGHASSTIRGRGNAHPDRELNNVKVIKDEMPEWELIDLVKRHDVLVYPSYGEGFGLIPLQAMMTGMPVICTEAWAPYKRFLLPGLKVSSTMVASNWHVHTGNMFEPDKHDLYDAMVDVVKYFDTFRVKAYDQVPAVAKAYDWNTLTENAFAHIVEKFA